MAVFTYQGVNREGKSVSGTLDAENPKLARSKLRRQNIFPTVIKLADGSDSSGFDLAKKFERITVRDIATLTRQLATLLNAKIPLVDAIEALVDQTENSKLKNALASIKEKVVEGAKLSDAMTQHPKIFNHLFISMVRAGEVSGALDTVLDRLADFNESQAGLKSKIIGAMIYPIIMLVMGLSLVTGLMVTIIPEIINVLNSAKIDLPLPTYLLDQASKFFAGYWYLVIIAIVASIFAFSKYKKTPQGRRRLDKIKLKLPIFGSLMRKVAISRFSKTLSTLLSSGVPLVKALDIVEDVVGNVLLAEVIRNTKVAVQEGESISQNLGSSDYFPPLVIKMLAIGEKTGQLEAMLERVSDTYDTEVDTQVSSLTSALEPVMLIGMGAMIFFIVLAVILPMMDMTKARR